ncbi:hypothetical protein BYT27DRAFT_7194314 [Phlegmacium glaucopus]|nr:hypothetical protein BYT27DRAFT_7194314 [Phlegmacium glaucopus]
MGFFNFWSEAKVDQVVGEENVTVDSIRITTSATAGSPDVTVAAKAVTVESQGPTRRLSLRSLNFTRREVHKTALSAIQEQNKLEHALKPSTKRSLRTSISDKRAEKSALVLRSLIVGPTSTAALQTAPVVAKPDLKSIKSQLSEPKTANKVIAHLKELPASDDPLHAHKPGARGPIHAVCLAYTDAEMDALHFSKLISPSAEQVTTAAAYLPGVISVSVDKVAALFKEMHVVDLISAPDFGLGQPGDGEGILAGALPTAETVIEGVEQITPQLMALGFATGKALTPDHSGVYPPTDRMSVLTYWWGFELLLPPPSLVYLGNAQSITNAVMNFLSAVALINNGVREILPFIRYISQFVDFEFTSIRGQNRGKGVVCAATWIVPAALVPRPWDFPTRPQPPKKLASDTVKPADDIPSTPIPHDAPVPHDIPKVPDTSPEPLIENPTTPQPSVAALLAGS